MSDGVGTGKLNATPGKYSVGSVLTTRTVEGMVVCHTHDEWLAASVTGECEADINSHTVTHSIRCPVVTSTSASCPLPHATAFDHHEGNLGSAPVTTSLKLYLKSEPGPHGLKLVNEMVTDLDYSTRGEYIFSYDAADSVGNQAETVNFVLQMVDEIPPAISAAHWEATMPQTVEACRHGNRFYEVWDGLTHGVTAYDQYDGQVSSTLNGGLTNKADSRTSRNFQIDTRVLGKHSVALFAHDYAAIFGKDNQNNVATHGISVTVTDTTPPEVHCKPSRPIVYPGSFPTDLSYIKMISTKTLDDCADACFEQTWRSFKMKTECEFFEYAMVHETDANSNDAHNQARMGTCKMYNFAAARHFNAQPGSNAPGVAVSYHIGYNFGCKPKNMGQKGVYVKHTQEVVCGQAWSDPGAICIDAHGSMQSDGTYSAKEILPVVHSNFTNSSQPGVHMINYTCTDSQNNTAVSTRTFEVTDPAKPQLIIHGDHALQYQFGALSTSDSAATVQSKTAALQALLTSHDDNGFSCVDACEGDMSAQVITEITDTDCMGAFQCYNDKGHLTTCENKEDYGTATVKDMVHTPGQYAIKYTCTDGSNNGVSRCRTVFTDESASPPWELDDAVVEFLAVATTASMHEETGGGSLDEAELAHNVVISLPFSKTDANATVDRSSTDVQTTYKLDVTIKASACGSACRSDTTAMVEESARQLCSTYNGILNHIVIPGVKVIPCAVDCELSTWGRWERCSSPCGPAVKSRSRTIITPASNGGKPCPRALDETTNCNILTPCPANCKVAWRDWTPCSVSCGGGYQMRERTVLSIGHSGGKDCPLAQERTCNTHHCPVDCRMSQWSSWSSCSRLCNGGMGAGSRTRSRSVLQPPVVGGVGCGPTEEIGMCGAQRCPINCIPEKSFGDWSTCSNKCGDGVMTRTRGAAVAASNGGAACLAEDMKQTMPCSGTFPDCPSKCTATKWGSWTSCSATCNIGTKTRRAVSIPDPACPSLQTETCATYVACPVDCVAGAWTDFDVCRDTTTGNEITCGTGTQTRTRAILRPKMGNGDDCVTTNSRWCETQACPVDCEQTSFSSWSSCSKAACGGGIRTRERSTVRYMQNGGEPCGPLTEHEECNTEPCPEDCRFYWKEWTACSTSCGTGVQTRDAVLTKAAGVGGKNNCPTHESRLCSTSPCPVDCVMAPWGNWGPCSESCGTKTQRIRQRRVTRDPAHGGKPCPASENTQWCTEKPCPVDCATSIWSNYSPCSAHHCGGVMTRTKTILQQPLHGGAACPALKQFADCSNTNCPATCANQAHSLLSDWSACSARCGGGTQQKQFRRGVTQDKIDAFHNAGCSELERVCNDFACPLDCHATPWSEWSSCTATCGSGVRMRTRSVVHEAHYGGLSCGALAESAECNAQACAVDCVVDHFVPWSQCSKTCQANPADSFGLRTRSRKVLVSARNEGTPCPPLSEHEVCGTEACPAQLWGETESPSATPIDCEMSTWSAVSPCTSSCGSGKQFRFRKVKVQAQNGGNPCSAVVKQTIDCSRPCPADCVVGKFTDWTECSLACGGGSRSRTRDVLAAAKFGGVACPATLIEDSCNTAPCAVNCAFTGFGPFSDCSATCGTGVQTRHRELLTPAAHGGKACPEMHNSRSCMEGVCPVDCEVGDWSGWSPCTVTCGTGRELRTRMMLRAAANHGRKCPPLSNHRSCKKEECKLPCVMGPWSDWDACTLTCSTGKFKGQRLRSRPVVRDAVHGGAACLTQNETMVCNDFECPTDCRQKAWQPWQPCDRTCGGGLTVRRRTLVHGPSHGGKACGASEEQMWCANSPCAVDCVAGDWSAWTDCPVTCGVGKSNSYRSIRIPALHGGKACPSRTRTKKCLHGNACPTYAASTNVTDKHTYCEVSQFDQWSECSTTCGTGYKVRERIIERRGANCPHTLDVTACNEQVCPVDCEVADWEAWSPCSHSCGSGVETRRRAINVDHAGTGIPCPKTQQHRSCNDNLPECPVDCVMGGWVKVSVCDAQCGGGKQRWYRNIYRPSSFGGKACSHMEKFLDCNSHACPVNCIVGSYSDFSGCTKVCGTGTKIRRRPVVVKPAYGGKACPKRQLEVVCNTHSCNDADCQLTGFGSWTRCSHSCGKGGLRYRHREIKQHGTDYGTSCDALLANHALTEEQPCFLGDCPRKCKVSEWSAWGACSKSCGGGKEKRTRKILTHGAGGYVCPNLVDQVDCNAQDCPVDCEITSWKPWTKCSTKCGGGMRSRTRKIRRQPSNGGRACEALTMTEVCNTEPCAVDCLLSAYGPMSECSATCGGGSKSRTRTIRRANEFGGKPCKSLVEVIKCADTPCAVNCEVGDWDEWTPCTQSCGTQFKSRDRPVQVKPQYHGMRCPIELKQQEKCDVPAHCPVDCVHSAWSEWTTCSQTCHAAGGKPEISIRVRTTVHDAMLGGVACGANKESKPCMVTECPVDCKVTAWGDYSPCTVTCGDGVEVRVRDVISTNSHGGAACPELSESRTCHDTHGHVECPVHCTVSEWSDFTQCSKECGGGDSMRTRTVTQSAKHGGFVCPHLNETEPCNTQECPVDCKQGDWRSWTDCSADCGTGVQVRLRVTRSVAKFGGQACGPVQEQRLCNTKPCSVDCVIGEFSQWSLCSAPCGVGSQSRSRTVVAPPAYGGKSCGHEWAIRSCHSQPCPIDCQPGNWTDWSSCDKSCGGGTKYKHRPALVKAQFGGQECTDDMLVLSEFCNTDLCEVDCVPGEWEAWTRCSATCGNGWRYATRSVVTPAVSGGKPCASLEREEACHLEPCPVDCVVTSFSRWSECTKSCGGGARFIARSVAVAPAAGGKACPPLTKTEECQSQPCPIDCQTEGYSDWSDCSKQCDEGVGQMQRSRVVVRLGAYGGVSCDAAKHMEYMACNVGACPVDSHMTVCGSSHVCKKAPTAEPDQTKHEVRCCSDTKHKKYHKRNGCSVWGESLDINDIRCIHAATWQEAQNHCAQDGARLCTQEELSADCTKHSGCGHDADMIWSSTPKAQESTATSCVRGAWSAWTECTKSCGRGLTNRTRAPDSGYCPEHLQSFESANCAEQPCPADCATGDWGSWSTCPVSCGTGTQTRTRTVLSPAFYGGVACGATAQRGTCNEHECPIDCKLTDHQLWGDWNDCSTSCNAGTRSRLMSIAVNNAYGGVACPADLTHTEKCNLGPCPVHCAAGHLIEETREWRPWGDWSQCSTTCGGGLKFRTRQVHIEPKYGGNSCPSLTDTSVCNMNPCPVPTESVGEAIDCQHGDWSEYAPCTARCGSGTQVRARPITVYAANGGQPCLGDTIQHRGCNHRKCDRDCELSEWGDWEACDATCGNGHQRRFRTIIRYSVGHGLPCPDVMQGQAKECAHPHKCPVDCGMGDWNMWGACDVSCGGGHATRTRVIHDAAKYDGAACQATVDTETCSDTACPNDCEMGDWSAWSQCTVSCGGGSRSRTRVEEQPPIYGGAACGPSEEHDTCLSTPCVVDCVEGPWSKWGDCDAACGPGVMKRMRYVAVEPMYNGKVCRDLEHVIDCDSGVPCTTECESEWGVWSGCSATCGMNGVQTRTLATQAEPAVGGSHCPKTETRTCLPALPACPVETITPLPPAPTPPPTVESTPTAPRPILTLLGSENLALEAGVSQLADPGAKCFDPLDGDISGNIMVSGDIGSTVGRYVLSYQCTNPKRGTSAHAMTRIVTVQDTRCPQCHSFKTQVTVEASFPYDEKADLSCTDEATNTTLLNKNVVHFGDVDVEQVGTYYVTYRVKDANGNWNDGDCVGPHHYIRTVVVVDSLKPVIGLKIDGKKLALQSQAEVSDTTGETNPVHAKFGYPLFAESSMTLMAQGASSNSWWTFGAIAGAIGCAVVGAALRVRREGLGWRKSGELHTLV
jgi:hypothetical protein